jgi:hypothetical protein
VQDANLVLQATVTKTADFDGAGLDLKGGTSRRMQQAKVLVTALSGATPSVTFSVQDSADNATFAALGSCSPVTSVGASYIGFETSKRYIRLSADLSAGTSSVTYSAAVVAGRP